MSGEYIEWELKEGCYVVSNPVVIRWTERTIDGEYYKIPVIKWKETKNER